MDEFVIKLLKRTAAVLGISEKEMIDAAGTALCSLRADEYLDKNPLLKKEVEDA